MNDTTSIKVRTKEDAIQLRKKGKSYNEISKQLGIPKSTLGGWFKKLPFSEIVKNNLVDKNRLIWARNIIGYNKSRPAQTLIRHNNFKSQARTEFKKIRRDPLFISGIMIYWGEGDKINNGRVSVANSDIKLIKIFKNFLRSVCHVEESRIKLQLFIYPNLDEKECKQEWEKHLGLSEEHFIKTQVLPSRSKLTKNQLRYGILSIYTCSTELKIKILTWIEEFYNNYAGVV